jgi:putative flippase GtrA
MRKESIMANSSDLKLDLLPGARGLSTRLGISPNPVFWQAIRFVIVGISNVTVDVLILNLLLMRFPTTNTGILLSYNSVAYALGAINSYVLNKHWTFHSKRGMTGSELLRFAAVNAAGILCSNCIIWIAAGILKPVVTNDVFWVNASKAAAIVGTAMLSYLGMRLWVFASASRTKESEKRRGRAPQVTTDAQEKPSSRHLGGISNRGEAALPETKESAFRTRRSLSVVLPAYNEETVIAEAVYGIASILTPWVQDFEVIVVNDGSRDSTQAIVEHIMATDSRVRIINHPVNLGYGAALVSGFEAATKDLVFFTDSDGQFDAHDLEPFFPLIEKYDVVLGYRIKRRDRWMRKLNAWGWNLLVSLLLGVRVRDVDCAFKLYRADFFHTHRLETRGAMINAEILYKLKRCGYTYTQVGVRHLPRRSGQATGARLSVIVRALRELFTYAWKWHRE